MSRFFAALPRKPATAFLASALAVVLLAASSGVGAQQSGVSGLMQAFGTLPPDQQQAILQRLGTQTSGALVNPGVTGAGPVAPNPAAAAANRLPGSTAPASSNQDTLAAVPVFAPDDTVLLDINLPGEKSVAKQAIEAYERELRGTSLSQSAADATTAGANPAPAPQVPQSTQDAHTQQAERDLLKVLNDNNPYGLDRDGVLQLPGFRPIELAGLNEAEATRRLAAEPALRDFELRVIRLPVAKRGAAALKPYGYDLFESGQQGLAAVTSSPAPDDYVVGPGDTLEVQLYGNQNNTLQLTVGRDGIINFPQLGPINVGGQRYGAVKRTLEARIEKQMIGVRASVSMGETRTISVFVLGEAMYPGSYPVTGLATVTTALFAAGGVKPQGSLRRVQVRRQGALVREFDLYDLLMRGDSSNDVKLQPGDVVMVPPVGPTASADGEVQRPAIYELKGPVTVANLIDMAGGLTPEADPGSASLVHVNAERARVVIDVNPAAPSAQAQGVGNGDALRVARLKPTLDSGVSLQGYVYRPGSFAWREGLRLTDVIGSIDELRPNADQNYVLIRRVLTPGRRIAVLSADLAAALRDPASPANVALQPRDTLTVFDLQTGRERIIGPLMLELALQGNLEQPTETVHVDGQVKVPGDYPLERGMRVSDLLRAGGSLEPSAYGGRAELSRFTVEKGEQRRTQIIAIDLAAVARGDEAANVRLEPFDELSVKTISGWTQQDQVVLSGEVRYPGAYAIQRGETLRSVIERAGGLTDLAFARGAVFMRQELRQREQEQLDRLADRLRADVASVALMAARANQAGAGTEVSVGQSLLAQLKSARAVGRLVIDLDTAIRAAPGSADDVVLRSGDELVVPRFRQEVMVLGEVENATSHLYSPDYSRDDYIAQSGGFTSQADRSRIYIVHANGRVASAGRRWLIGSGGEAIQPGDAVVVPLDTERLPSLPFWQSVTQILYNIAFSAAAINRF